MNKRVVKATKWSIVSEIIAKLISPVTTIILARLLAQEVFGIVASITAIVSLADLLTDAGFNAYIIQHQFQDEEEKKSTYNVCFWSNLAISLILFLIIAFNSNLFSKLVGAEGYGLALIVSSLILPLTSVSSIEQAIMRKNLDFKKAGIIKVVAKTVPLFTTVPLAIFGFNYWSIIIGTLAGEIVSVVLCLVLGEYKPKLNYSFKHFRKIFSFSGWAFTESILEWLIANVAVLVLANIYGNYYLGVFKTGLALITQISMSLYALYSNVFKSAISKEQFNQKEFEHIFYVFQRWTSVLSIPIGVGAFLYRMFLTNVLLGSGWEEAMTIIGLWGLVSMLSIAFGNFYSDSIRAKGKPMLLVIIDSVYLISIVLLLIFAKNLSFEAFCVWFCALKVVQPVLQIVLGVAVCKINFVKVLLRCIPQIISSAAIVAFNLITRFYEKQFLYQVLGIAISVLIYFTIFTILTPHKKELIQRIKQYRKQKAEEENNRSLPEQV